MKKSNHLLRTARAFEGFPNPSLGRSSLRPALTPDQSNSAIDLSGKASGSYLFRLHSHCGVVATKQLVVQ